MFFFYWAGLRLYEILILLASPFNIRAKEMLVGRKNIWKEIDVKLKSINEKRVWFHVASMGEYEQARPIMEALKHSDKTIKIITTFFSPSGYNALQNDKSSDYVFYLPFDSKKNANKLIEMIQPCMAFWVKYDLWYYYIQELKSRKIPCYLLSAAFRSNQIYFKPYGLFFKSILQNFTQIFTQNIQTNKLLSTIQVNSIFSNDTRFDRVLKSVNILENIPEIEKFKSDSLLIVAGSSYEIEEIILSDFFAQNKLNIKLIIAPHFVEKNRILEIENNFLNQTIKWSEYKISHNDNDRKILILDCIGLLSKVYRYADFALIGGGFTHGGLHNILEAAAFGVPTFFGPKINKFPEASDLVYTHGAIVVNDAFEFKLEINNLINNPEALYQVSNKAKTYIQHNSGATQIVMEYLSNNAIYP